MPRDTENQLFTGELPDSPEFAEQDWDQIEDVEVLDAADVTLEELEGEAPDDLPDEDDDNPYQDSDEALPDDREERSIARDPDRDGKPGLPE
jgi:hypothetical protein